MTSCNVIFVALIGLLFNEKVRANVWLGVGITVFGLYFLCINGDFNVMLSDLLVLICSVMNAARIIAVDRYMNKTDTAKLACVQFFLHLLYSPFWRRCSRLTASLRGGTRLIKARYGFLFFMPE